MRLLALFALFALAGLLCPLFLVGPEDQYGKVPVLCDSQSEVFVSSPDGVSERLSLDSSFQTGFSPKSQGPYTVQCGKETKTISANGNWAIGKTGEPPVEIQWWLVASLAVSFAAMLAATALIAHRYLHSRTLFVKSVAGKNAEIYLKAGKNMADATVSDSCGSAPVEFSIPKLKAGAEWVWVYELDPKKRALPSVLKFKEMGREITVYSELVLEGKKIGSQLAQLPLVGKKSFGNLPQMQKQKRKLPKSRG